MVSSFYVGGKKIGGRGPGSGLAEVLHEVGEGDPLGSGHVHVVPDNRGGRGGGTTQHLLVTQGSWSGPILYVVSGGHHPPCSSHKDLGRS